MALVDRHYAFVTLMDSRQKTSTFEVRVRASEATAYFGAVTQIIKDATPVGQLLLSIEDLSAGTMISKGVTLRTFDDAAVPPALEDHIFTFDKIGVKFRGGLQNYQITIPARDGAQFTVAGDGVTIITEGAGADQQVLDFISRFEAVAVAANETFPTVTGMLVVS